MLNGLLTLRGAWNKLITDPVIKFFAAGVTFYGMSTFEGPLLSIRAVNYLSHYSDWTIGHVHSGTLGWNGFMAAGMFYWIVPRLWNTKLASVKLANLHFWLGFVGILLYVGAMWASGIRQGLMLNALDDSGTAVRYPEFVETLTGVRALMLFRAIGGTLYLIGFLVLVVNVWKTIASGSPATVTQEVVVHLPAAKRATMGEMVFAEPSVAMLGLALFICLWLMGGSVTDWVSFAMVGVISVMSIVRFQQHKEHWISWYDRLSEHWVSFTFLALISVAIGGAIQIIPTVTVNRAENIEDRLQKVYTPLELAGRDIYVSEGCYNCHSQMIRMILPDVLRYGDYSRLGESIYDHPFQWGSKRTGPDLAREGNNRRPSSWHYQHMLDPRVTSPGSNMPAYPWLFDQKTDIKALPAKVRTLVNLGVPFPTMTRDEIEQHALEQGVKIATELKTTDPNVQPDTKIIALIAYLQSLGAYETPKTTASATAP
jgi:cytochrome c oxidase cbb3-type subunit I/II